MASKKGIRPSLVYSYFFGWEPREIGAFLIYFLFSK